MEELLLRLLENSTSLAILAFAWRMAESRYTEERKRAEGVVDRYLKHFEEEHPTIEKAGD